MASDDVTTPLLNPSPTDAPTVVVADANGGSSTAPAFSANELKDKARSWVQYIRDKAAQLKKDCVILFYALQDERTSRWSKFMPFLVLCYVLSPLDLIPDCIPIIGVLDDIIIAPALIWLAVKLIPKEVLEDAKTRAENEPILLGDNWIVATLIFIVWLLAIQLAAWFVLKKFFWGYDVIRSWFGGVLATLFVLPVIVFIVYVVKRVRHEKNLKEAFDRSVQEARQTIDRGVQQARETVDRGVQQAREVIAARVASSEAGYEKSVRETIDRQVQEARETVEREVQQAREAVKIPRGDAV